MTSAMVSSAGQESERRKRLAQVIACPKCNQQQLDIGVAEVVCPACGEAASSAEACSLCAERLPAGASFCPSCGARQGGVTCPHCQAPNVAAARFCASCGDGLPES